MDIETNKYPVFWKLIKNGVNGSNINNHLKCPMNYLYSLNIEKFRNHSSTLPMSYFFISHPLEKDKKQCKKVEDLISRYSLGMLDKRVNEDADHENHILLRSDFHELLHRISTVYISTNYSGLMSWLLNRTFIITPKMIEKSKKMNSHLKKNRPLLVKILYQVSTKSFLSCFKSG